MFDLFQKEIKRLETETHEVHLEEASNAEHRASAGTRIDAQLLRLGIVLGRSNVIIVQGADLARVNNFREGGKQDNNFSIEK